MKSRFPPSGSGNRVQIKGIRNWYPHFLSCSPPPASALSQNRNSSKKMVKKSDAKSGKSKTSTQPADPEAEEKKRLRSLALSKRILRRGAPAEVRTPLRPAKSVVKLDGRDVVKRGQRKSRFLFSFPGLLAPLSGGRIGELACLASKNPVLYLEFPQARFSFLKYYYGLWRFLLRVFLRFMTPLVWKGTKK